MYLKTSVLMAAATMALSPVGRWRSGHRRDERRQTIREKGGGGPEGGGHQTTTTIGEKRGGTEGALPSKRRGVVFGVGERGGVVFGVGEWPVNPC